MGMMESFRANKGWHEGPTYLVILYSSTSVDAEDAKRQCHGLREKYDRFAKSKFVEYHRRCIMHFQSRTILKWKLLETRKRI